MKLNNYFRISWMFQLLVGIGLFTVSFFIENQVMQAFLSAPMIALCLTLTLEAGKAMAIIWHRYMLTVPGSYPLGNRIASMVFRVGLVLLSALCSLLFLADHLDRPQLENIRQAELQAVQQTLDRELSYIDEQSQHRLAALNDKQQHERVGVQGKHQTRIAELEADLKNEMDNVVGGVFKGKRYKEIERLLNKQNGLLDAGLNTLAIRHMKQSKQLAEQLQQYVSNQRRVSIDKADQKREQIGLNDYATDERVNDSRIVALLKISESVFSQPLQPLQFVFAFSVLLSVLMEVGIMLAFDTITLAMLPALRVQHEAQIEMEVLKSQVRAEAEREDYNHESEIDRVSKRAERTMEQAETVLGGFADKAA